MNNKAIRRPLMGTDNILDLQNNGYKNTVSAIAEIVDNSIQANANKVDIVIINNTTKSSNNIEEILIIDNGDGMDEEEFGKALMMNSGTRSGARHGLGKYGQGLPNSSISQTRRVEVYTKKEKLLFNHIDLNEIFESQDPFLPEIEIKEEIDINFFKKTDYTLSKNGTIVRWVKPNKVNPATARLLADNVNSLIGRIFRYYLNGFIEGGLLVKTEINILLYDYNGKEYDLNTAQSINKVKPFDPMFLMKDTRMNDDFSDWENPTSIKHATAKKEFEIEVTNANNEIEKMQSKVEIVFSHVKAKERYRNGSGKGIANYNFGELYKKRNIARSRGYQNIYIMRANREIDYGDFGFMGGGIDKETMRWWSIEVKIDASLDSIIGIDNKKQQASNVRFIDANYEDESNKVIEWISQTIDSNITELKKIIEEQYFSSGELGEDNGSEEDDGSPITPIGPTEPGDTTGGDEIEPTNEDKEELFHWIKERYEDLTDSEINERVEWAFSISDQFIFVYSSLGDTSLYTYEVYGNKVLIEINYNHNFYKKFLKQLEIESSDVNLDKKIRSIRLLISSFVKAEMTNSTEDKNINRYMRKYKNSIAISLDEYIEDLFSN